MKEIMKKYKINCEKSSKSRKIQISKKKRKKDRDVMIEERRKNGKSVSL